MTIKIGGETVLYMSFGLWFLIIACLIGGCIFLWIKKLEDREY